MNSTVVSSIQLKSILRKIQGESGPLVTAFDRDRWHLFQHTGGSYGVWPSAMAVAAPVIPWHRAHLYKALVCVVLGLIALQYLLSGVLDGRSIETIFTINTPRECYPQEKVMPLVIAASTPSCVDDNILLGEGVTCDVT
ncbi:hypothetical protein PV326_004002 [Microctonus aethiopoides]|nr:hypothetical protein PV326_004002 [Microctonus aethiopoides]